MEYLYNAANIQKKYRPQSFRFNFPLLCRKNCQFRNPTTIFIVNIQIEPYFFNGEPGTVIGHLIALTSH